MFKRHYQAAISGKKQRFLEEAGHISNVFNWTFKVHCRTTFNELLKNFSNSREHTTVGRQDVLDSITAWFLRFLGHFTESEGGAKTLNGQ